MMIGRLYGSAAAMAAAPKETAFPVAAHFAAADRCGIEGAGAIKPYRATDVTSVPANGDQLRCKAPSQDTMLSRNNRATVIMEGSDSPSATCPLLIVNMPSPAQAAELSQPFSGRVLI